MNDRFLRACRCEPVDATPVWFMRQAGRYMPEYRALREKHSLLTLCRTPELAVEVTLQPVRALGVDAAILFSDLLLPLAPLGIPFDFKSGEGPVIERVLRGPADVDRLRRFEPREELKVVLDAIRLLRRELDGVVPLIGFGGAPFTLASYALEGGHSANFAATKTFMYDETAAWHRLAALLAELMADYLRAQAEAGAQALQVFDSWVGALDAADYRELVLPHMRALFDGLRGTGVPLIHFGTTSGHLLEVQREAGGDVIGVDWRTPLDEAWGRLPGVAVQGNLDPTLLFAPRERLLARVDDVLARAAGRPGHIFNLGHGILPTTPVESVKAVVDHVHERTPPAVMKDEARPDGVLLLAHGTPDSLTDIPAYLKLVRGGREAARPLVEEMTRNYAAIGGRSPLTDLTIAQAEALARVIAQRVYVGMRNWHPFVGTALAQAASDGVRRLVAIPMAPQYSTLSVAKYQDAVTQSCPPEVKISFVDSWYDHPLLLDAFGEKLRGALNAARWDAVVFTAHSLPVRVVEAGDPYPQHVRATASGVARRAGVAPLRIAYQSAGRTGEPWLGPSVDEMLEQVAAAGARRVLLAPIGFVCDHTEILYDLDVAAVATARQRGLELGRTVSLNTSPTFISALADLARKQLG